MKNSGQILKPLIKFNRTQQPSFGKSKYSLEKIITQQGRAVCSSFLSTKQKRQSLVNVSNHIEYSIKAYLNYCDLDFEQLFKEQREFLQSLCAQEPFPFKSDSLRLNQSGYFMLDLDGIVKRFESFSQQLNNKNICFKLSCDSDHEIGYVLFQNDNIFVLTEKNIEVTVLFKMNTLKVLTSAKIRLASPIQAEQDIFILGTDISDNGDILKYHAKTITFSAARECNLRGMIYADDCQIKTANATIRSGIEVDNNFQLIAASANISGFLFAKNTIQLMTFLLNTTANSHLHATTSLNITSFNSDIDGLLSTHRLIFSTFNANFVGKIYCDKHAMILSQSVLNFSEKTTFVFSGEITSNSQNLLKFLGTLLYDESLEIGWKWLRDPSLELLAHERKYYFSITDEREKHNEKKYVDPVSGFRIIPWEVPQGNKILLPTSLSNKKFSLSCAQKKNHIALISQGNAKISGKLYIRNASLSVMIKLCLNFSGAIWQHSLGLEGVVFTAARFQASGALFTQNTLCIKTDEDMNFEKARMLVMRQMLLQSGKNIFITQGTKLVGKNIQIKALEGKILNSKDSMLSAKNTISIETNKLTHFGELECCTWHVQAERSIVIKFAKQKCERIHLTAPIIIMLGSLQASHDVSITGGFSFLGGFIFAENYSNTSIINISPIVFVQRGITRPNAMSMILVGGNIALLIVATCCPAAQIGISLAQLSLNLAIRLFFTSRIAVAMRAGITSYIGSPTTHSTKNILYLTSCAQQIGMSLFYLATMGFVCFETGMAVADSTSVDLPIDFELDNSALADSMQDTTSATEMNPLIPTIIPFLPPTHSMALNQTIMLLEEMGAYLLTLFSGYNTVSLLTISPHILFGFGATNFSFFSLTGGMELLFTKVDGSIFSMYDGNLNFVLGPHSFSGVFHEEFFGGTYSLLSQPNYRVFDKGVFLSPDFLNQAINVKAHTMHMCYASISHANIDIQNLYANKHNQLLSVNLHIHDRALINEDGDLSMIGCHGNVLHIVNHGTWLNAGGEVDVKLFSNTGNAIFYSTRSKIETMNNQGVVVAQQGTQLILDKNFSHHKGILVAGGEKTIIAINHAELDLAVLHAQQGGHIYVNAGTIKNGSSVSTKDVGSGVEICNTKSVDSHFIANTGSAITTKYGSFEKCIIYADGKGSTVDSCFETNKNSVIFSRDGGHVEVKNSTLQHCYGGANGADSTFETSDVNYTKGCKFQAGLGGDIHVKNGIIENSSIGAIGETSHLSVTGTNVTAQSQIWTAAGGSGNLDNVTFNHSVAYAFGEGSTLSGEHVTLCDHSVVNAIDGGQVQLHNSTVDSHSSLGAIGEGSVLVGNELLVTNESSVIVGEGATGTLNHSTFDNKSVGVVQGVGSTLIGNDVTGTHESFFVAQDEAHINFNGGSLKDGSQAYAIGEGSSISGNGMYLTTKSAFYSMKGGSATLNGSTLDNSYAGALDQGSTFVGNHMTANNESSIQSVDGGVVIINESCFNHSGGVVQGSGSQLIINHSHAENGSEFVALHGGKGTLNDSSLDKSSKAYAINDHQQDNLHNEHNTVSKNAQTDTVVVEDSEFEFNRTEISNQSDAFGLSGGKITFNDCIIDNSSTVGVQGENSIITLHNTNLDHDSKIQASDKSQIISDHVDLRGKSYISLNHATGDFGTVNLYEKSIFMVQNGSTVNYKAMNNYDGQEFYDGSTVNGQKYTSGKDSVAVFVSSNVNVNSADLYGKGQFVNTDGHFGHLILEPGSEFYQDKSILLIDDTLIQHKGAILALRESSLKGGSQSQYIQKDNIYLNHAQITFAHWQRAKGTCIEGINSEAKIGEYTYDGHRETALQHSPNVSFHNFRSEIDGHGWVYSDDRKDPSIKMLLSWGKDATFMQRIAELQLTFDYATGTLCYRLENGTLSFPPQHIYSFLPIDYSASNINFNGYGYQKAGNIITNCNLYVHANNTLYFGYSNFIVGGNAFLTAGNSVVANNNHVYAFGNLDVASGGNLVNHGSTFGAKGYVHVQAQNDIMANANINWEKSHASQWSSHHNRYTEHTQKKPIFSLPGFYSETQDVVIESLQGKVDASGTVFQSDAGKVYIIGDKGVFISDEQAMSTETVKETQLLFSTSYKKIKTQDTISMPSIIKSRTGIEIYAHEGNVKIRSTLFYSDGKVCIEGIHAEFDRGVLEHHVTSNNFKGGISSLCGINIQSPYSAIPFYDAVDSYSAQNSTVENAVLGFNCAQEAINSLAYLSRNGENLAKNVFTESVGKGITYTMHYENYNTHYQTLGYGEINAPQIYINARESIKVNHGFGLNTHSMNFNAPLVEIDGGQTNASSTSRSTAFDFGAGSNGYHFGLNYHQATGSSITNNFANYYWDDFSIHANTFRVNSAGIEADNVVGHVDQIFLKTQQDLYREVGWGIGANTDGSIYMNAQKMRSNMTQSQSYLNMHHSNNFYAGDLISIGSKTVGFNPKTTQYIPIFDMSKNKQYGVNINFSAFFNETDPLPTMLNIDYGNDNYKARVDQSGRNISHENHLHFNIDVPIINIDATKHLIYDVKSFLLLHPQKIYFINNNQSQDSTLMIDQGSPDISTSTENSALKFLEDRYDDNNLESVASDEKVDLTKNLSDHSIAELSQQQSAPGESTLSDFQQDNVDLLQKDRDRKIFNDYALINKDDIKSQQPQSNLANILLNGLLTVLGVGAATAARSEKKEKFYDFSDDMTEEDERTDEKLTRQGIPSTVRVTLPGYDRDRDIAGDTATKCVKNIGLYEDKEESSKTIHEIDMSNQEKCIYNLSFSHMPSDADHESLLRSHRETIEQHVKEEHKNGLKPSLSQAAAPVLIGKQNDFSLLVYPDHNTHQYAQPQRFLHLPIFDKGYAAHQNINFQSHSKVQDNFHLSKPTVANETIFDTQEKNGSHFFDMQYDSVHEIKYDGSIPTDIQKVTSIPKKFSDQHPNIHHIAFFNEMEMSVALFHNMDTQHAEKALHHIVRSALSLFGGGTEAAIGVALLLSMMSGIGEAVASAYAIRRGILGSIYLLGGTDEIARGLRQLFSRKEQQTLFTQALTPVVGKLNAEIIDFAIALSSGLGLWQFDRIHLLQRFGSTKAPIVYESMVADEERFFEEAPYLTKEEIRLKKGQLEIRYVIMKDGELRIRAGAGHTEHPELARNQPIVGGGEGIIDEGHFVYLDNGSGCFQPMPVADHIQHVFRRYGFHELDEIGFTVSHDRPLPHANAKPYATVNETWGSYLKKAMGASAGKLQQSELRDAQDNFFLEKAEHRSFLNLEKRMLTMLMGEALKFFSPEQLVAAMLLTQMYNNFFVKGNYQLPESITNSMIVVGGVGEAAVGAFLLLYNKDRGLIFTLHGLDTAYTGYKQLIHHEKADTITFTMVKALFGTIAAGSIDMGISMVSIFDTTGLYKLAMLERFGVPYKPLLYNATVLPSAVDRELDEYTIISKDFLRTMMGEQKMLYVIDDQGRVKLGLPKYVWQDDRFFDGASNYETILEQLADGKPGMSFGKLNVIDGKITYVTNQSIYYAPWLNDQQKIVETVFTNEGFTEIRGKFDPFMEWEEDKKTYDHIYQSSFKRNSYIPAVENDFMMTKTSTSHLQGAVLGGAIILSKRLGFFANKESINMSHPPQNDKPLNDIVQTTPYQKQIKK
jgi:hypothetical protein